MDCDVDDGCALPQGGPFGGPVADPGDGPTIWYVTDPICGACWAFEPMWRRLRYHYGETIAIRTVYGGLLPGWTGFSDPGAGISGPQDVAPHWDAMSVASGQPIDSSVWRRDPIASSYPPSIAAVAVRRLAPRLETVYLRRLREELFLRARNIARPQCYLAVAEQLGIDPGAVGDLVADGSAAEEFQRDRQLTRALRAPGFPTVIVQGKGVRRAHFGVTPYAQVEAALLEVAGVPARRGAPTMVQVLAQYGGGTSREFAEVLEVTPGEAEQMLRAAGASRAEDGLWRVVP